MSVPPILPKLSQNVLSTGQPTNTNIITSIFQFVFSAIQSTFNSTPVKAAVGFVTSKTGMITLVGIGALIVVVWYFKSWKREDQSNTSTQVTVQDPSTNDSPPPQRNIDHSSPDITHEELGQEIVDLGEKVVEEAKEKPWTAFASLAQGASGLPDNKTQGQAVGFWKDTAKDVYVWAQENETCQTVVTETMQMAEAGAQKLASAKDGAKEIYNNCRHTLSAKLEEGTEVAKNVWNNPTEFKDRAVEKAKAGVKQFSDDQLKKQAFEDEAFSEAWEMCKSWVSNQWKALVNDEEGNQPAPPK